MATYRMTHPAPSRSVPRMLVIATLLAASLAAGFQLGRVSAPKSEGRSAAQLTTLRPRDLSEPAWRIRLHQAMNELDPLGQTQQP